GGAVCPISYVSPTQVNAKLPASLTPGWHYLQLGISNQQKDFVPFMVEAIVPALFTLAGNTAAAQHSNYQVVSTSYPAAAGEIISLYATGLGATTLRNGLQVANSIPQVFIDGLAAKVMYAGRAYGYEGLDQINIQVPANIHHTTNVSVVITSGNRTS